MIKFYSTNKEYNWLSNFYFSPIIIEGIKYPTIEHFYQSQKFKDKKIREWISICPYPRLIYLLTRMIKKDDKVKNWEEIKFKIMEKGIYEKFTQNKELKKKLLKTNDQVLHEDSFDKIWGISGEDRLGKLLMKVREKLKTME